MLFPKIVVRVKNKFLVHNFAVPQFSNFEKMILDLSVPKIFAIYDSKFLVPSFVLPQLSYFEKMIIMILGLSAGT